jgi:hypothetical protein
MHALLRRNLFGSYWRVELYKLPCRKRHVLGVQNWIHDDVRPLLRWFLLGFNWIDRLRSVPIEHDLYRSSHQLHDPSCWSELSRRHVLGLGHLQSRVQCMLCGHLF